MNQLFKYLLWVLFGDIPGKARNVFSALFWLVRLQINNQVEDVNEL